jgi:hypothetical protein
MVKKAYFTPQGIDNFTKKLIAGTRNFLPMAIFPLSFRVESLRIFSRVSITDKN